MDGRDSTVHAGLDPIARARSVAPLLAKGADRIEAARELPPDLLAALHEARLFRLLLPKSLGGDECDFVTLAKVTEIIAAADASTAWCLGQGGGCAMSAAYLEPAVARRLFGRPDAVLAWGAGAVGSATRVAGGFRISGQWSFASGSRHATLLGAHCRVFDADGRPELRPDGRQVEHTALFPRAKATIHDVWQVVGLRGTGSDTYDVEDLVVPVAETVDREGLSEVHEPGTLYRFAQMLAYSSAFGGVMLGIARGTLDDLRTLAMTKTARGAASSMRDSQVFQFDLARLEARLGAARAYHHQAYGAVWAAVDAGSEVTLDHRIAVRLASTHAINEGVDIVAQAYRAAGQSAIFETNPFERRLRDANSASQQVQGRPSHYTTVGRHFLGLPPDTMMFI